MIKSLKHLLLFITVALAACGRETLLDQSRELPAAGWSATDTLDFQFEVTDTLAVYDILVDLAHATTYPNQNVYVKVLTEFPNGAKLDQTLSLELANRAGRWFGDCDAESCDFEVAIQRSAFFNQTGQHRIRVLPYMRRDPVEHVRNFGVRIEATGERRG